MQIGALNVEVVQGDITNQRDVDAVVNAANARLMPGGGVAGAIHRAAGRGLAEECRRFSPIEPGQAIVTGAHNLPNCCVIHCLGPVYGRDKPAAALLADCYRNALRLADEKGMRSVAFPAISTGAFGYPPGEAAAVSARAVTEMAPSLAHVRLIRLVVLGSDMERTVRDAFESVNRSDD